jgi:hypothetical protein
LATEEDGATILVAGVNGEMLKDLRGAKMRILQLMNKI